MSHGVVGIHGERMPERPDRKFRLAFLLENLSHKDVGAGGSRLQPD